MSADTMATEPTAPASLPPTMAGLPSIYDLGVELALARHAQHRADKARLAAKDDQRRRHTLDIAVDLLHERGVALCDIISTLEPVTLRDVAVQIEIASGIADNMVANEHTAAELVQFSKTLLRMMLGALPVVAAAAELDMTAMQWQDSAALRAHQFAALEFIA